MKLEINKNHKKINLSNLKYKNKVTSTLLSSILALTLFSGCSYNNSMNNIASNNEVTYEESYDVETSYQDETISKEEIQKKIDSIRNNNIIYVPDIIKSQLLGKNKDNDVTVSFLQYLTDVNLSLPCNTTKDDLLWLNYCTNLNTLTLIINNDEVLDYILELPKLERLAINNIGQNTHAITNNTHILFSPNLNYLILTDFNIQKGLLESLTNLQNLDISSNEDPILLNYDIDYTKLTNLKMLIVDNLYTLAIHLDSNELNTLLNSNVKIVNKKLNDMSEKLIEINKKIDEMVSYIEENSNDNEEKLDSIIMYILKTLKYDPEVSEQIKNNDNDNKHLDKFYKNGCLYGALELDTQICGNYAALMSTLCDRFKIDAMTQLSKVHAWNLVYVDGLYYYVDSTLIDSGIKNEEDIEEMRNSKWYLRKPSTIDDHSHNPVNLSEIISIEEIACNDNFDISNNIYKLSLFNKQYIVNGAILIGILSGLGLAYQENKDKTLVNISNQSKHL